MNDYLYIYPQIEFIEYHIGSKVVLVFQSPEQQLKNPVKGRKKYEINEISKEILLQFDGTKNYTQIIKHFSEKYNESLESIKSKIENLLVPFTNKFEFEIRKQTTPDLKEIKSSIYYNIYPSVVSLELTNRCNIRCKHCYGDFGINRVDSIKKDDLSPIFKHMSEVGVLTVELTGGDPSVYEYTEDAIELAFQSGIQSVMLLTNGISLRKSLIDVLEKYKDKMIIQIDLHSLNEEYFDWFTGSQGNLNKVKQNIDLLVSKGVNVRACSILTPKNYHELIDIADWAYTHNVKLYAASLVTEIGRATDKNTNSELLFTDINDLEAFTKLYDEMLRKYPNFTRATSLETKAKAKNCSTLTSQCSIKSSGDIKLCTMDTGEYFNLNLGNIFIDSLKDIYDSNKDFIHALTELQAPKMVDSTCKDCEHFYFCDSCLLRSFLRAQDMNDKCNWFNNCVDPIIKKRFRKKDLLKI